MTTTSEPENDSGDEPQYSADDPRSLDLAAAWMARVVARVTDPVRSPLPGIVSPLAFSADFAENSQSDVVSITMGNGRARLISAAVDGSSGALHLSLRWSRGFRAHGLAVDSLQEGGWAVDSLGESAAEMSRPALTTEAREVVLPTVSVLKTAGPSDDDELIVRLWGDAADCRGASVRGWSRA